MIRREYYYNYNNYTISNNPQEEERRSRRNRDLGGHESNVVVPTNRRQENTSPTGGEFDGNISGGERLVTSDGDGSRNSGFAGGGSAGITTNNSRTRPRIMSKWGSREGETIKRAKSAGVVKGDRELERMLAKPKWANSYLVSYKTTDGEE